MSAFNKEFKLPLLQHDSLTNAVHSESTGLSQEEFEHELQELRRSSVSSKRTGCYYGTLVVVCGTLSSVTAVLRALTACSNVLYEQKSLDLFPFYLLPKEMRTPLEPFALGLGIWATFCSAVMMYSGNKREIESWFRSWADYLYHLFDQHQKLENSTFHPDPTLPRLQRWKASFDHWLQETRKELYPNIFPKPEQLSPEVRKFLEEKGSVFQPIQFQEPSTLKIILDYLGGKALKFAAYGNQVLIVFSTYTSNHHAYALIMPSGWAIGSSAACAAARVPAYSGREWPWAWQEYRINRALSLAPPELQKFINYKSAEYQTKNSVPKMKIGAFGVYFEFEKPTGKNILILFNNAGLALSFYFILDLGIKQLGINDFPGLAWFIKIDLIGSLLAMNICGRQANLIQQIEGDVSSLLAYWSSLNNRNLPLDNEARYATIRKEREELVGCCNPKPPRIEGLFDDLPFLKVLFGITFFVSLTNQWIGTWFQNFVGMASTLTDLGKSDDSEAFSITWSAISVLVSVILAQIATELLMSYKFFNAEMELRGQIIHLYAFLNKLVCNEVDTEALIARLPTNQARKNKSDRHARHKDQISLVIEPAASDINTEFSINSSAPAEDADMAEKRTEWSMCLQKWCCGTTATKKHNRLNAQASSQSALTLVAPVSPY